MKTYVNMLKILVSQPCVRRFRHIETQSNHALTGAYVSNQSTTGSVIQDFVFPSRKSSCIRCISLQVYNKS